MVIKYYEYRTGERDYGDDHKLTNNWNPDLDYGKEYAKVYFNMETEGYCYPSFSLTDVQKGKFTDDINRIFSSIGWICEEPERKLSGVCAIWRKGKSHLYMHPQCFSGEVLKNDIKEVAEALQDSKVFSLRWVDIRETVYDISNEEYKAYLSGRKKEICTMLYEQFETTRKNKAYDTSDVVKRVTNRYGLKRIGNKIDRIAIDYIKNIIIGMAAEGFVVVFRDGDLMRSLNKTEKRKKPLVI